MRRNINKEAHFLAIFSYFGNKGALYRPLEDPTEAHSCNFFLFHILGHSLLKQDSVSANQQPQAAAAAQRMNSSLDTRSERWQNHKRLDTHVKKTAPACTFFIKHYQNGYCWIEK